ncbi:MAG TPA: tryptophan 2,3-dioxygenase family protein [Candidatus Thermoplasmatota archaeon]|nr:tryptophan 2,3-dioxygenase family protein [Candidatus Thermoplasmatota archaeon]
MSTPPASFCPVNHGEPNVAPGGTPTVTDYERYMMTEALLGLQKPEDQRVHHDELMFQVVHQSFELWCKLILFELKSVGTLLEQDRIIETYPLLQRCTHAIKLSTESMHVLESMTPWDFHVIRAALGQGSGAESPGFRQIQQRAPAIWPKVEALLARRKTTLLETYTNPAKAPDVLRLLENLTDFDMFFSIWRLNHLAMVKRVIGRDVKSLKGYAVHQLETDVQGQLWPALWKVRNLITEKAGTSPP